MRASAVALESARPAITFQAKRPAPAARVARRDPDLRCQCVAYNSRYIGNIALASAPRH